MNFKQVLSIVLLLIGLLIFVSSLIFGIMSWVDISFTVGLKEFLSHVPISLLFLGPALAWGEGWIAPNVF
jgi:hypothetical protein|tara:strand:- start:149 stop:358 length:210 start_codon:yes stop_codon:yes gene_type:complete